MKIERRINSQLLLILLIPAFIFINCLTVFSQTPANSRKDQLLLPSEEKFEKAGDTIAPRRETGCLNSFSEKDFYGKTYHVITKDAWDKREIATLYNAVTYNITLKVDPSRTPLLDKPDGKIIEESSQTSIMKVDLLKTEGDWAYVRTDINQKEYDGWIRWRKGRYILVGTVFTNQKIPDVKLDTENN